MERADILELMTRLKLYGMGAAGACPRAGLWPDPGDEVMTTGIKRRPEPARIWRMAERLQRRQNDDCAPRPSDPSLRNHRNRQRELALQTPRLSATPACPGGQTGCGARVSRPVAGSSTRINGLSIPAVGGWTGSAPRQGSRLRAPASRLSALTPPRSQSVRLGKRRRSAPTLGQGQRGDSSQTDALDN